MKCEEPHLSIPISSSFMHFRPPRAGTHEVALNTPLGFRDDYPYAGQTRSTSVSSPSKLWSLRDESCCARTVSRAHREE
jgi:hypothetical protein